MRAALNNPMVALSSALDVCAPLCDGTLLLLDYPVHGNVGDLLIWMGEKAFFKRHGKTVLGQYSINNIGRRATHLLEECTTICFHGGGNFGDLWPRHQKLRESIIQQYPHKRIVILPQSVHFDDPQELDNACTILRRHPDLHIFLRDKHSLEVLQDKGVPNLKLCPDMAHALWGSISAAKPTLSSPLYLLRRDKEESTLPSDVAAMRSLSVDWADILTGWTRRAYKVGRRINELDGRQMNNHLPAFTAWSVAAQLLVHRAVELVAPYETIITNRLHAVILSALLSRKVIAFDNSYGKLSSYMELWLSEFPNIVLPQ